MEGSNAMTGYNTNNSGYIWLYMMGYIYIIYIYIYNIYISIYLVGGFHPTPLKNDGSRQLGFSELPNMMGKIEFMFQTSNQ